MITFRLNKICVLMELFRAYKRLIDLDKGSTPTYSGVTIIMKNSIIHDRFII